MFRLKVVRLRKGVDDYISLKMDPEQMSPGVRDVTYYLDKMGNRLSVRDTGTTKTYTPNNLNEYSAVQGNTIVYNMYHQHELDTYGSVNYTYRNDEQLVNAARTDTGTSYSLAYDALGRCVTRMTSVPGGSATKYYIYDGEKPILEYDNSGALVALNVYGKGIDEILMRTDYTFPSQTLAPGVTFYHQQDHEGSVIHLTDTNGALMERYRYDVYGAPTIYPPSPSATPIPASAVSNRFLFTGREYAGAFGFYEYRARAYHPGLGRFTSEDSKLFVRRIPLGKSSDDWSFSAHPEEAEFNLYRYCGNDPLDFTDPMGLQIEVFLETELPRPIMEEMVRGALELNKGRNSVRLPDGRRIDLAGRAHPDPKTGEPIETPHVHEPKPPFQPPYDKLFPNRGTQRVPRPAKPDDIKDVIKHLLGKSKQGGDSAQTQGQRLIDPSRAATKPAKEVKSLTPPIRELP